MRVKHFEENKLGKDYVVGDIHGCFHKLQIALWLMEFDETKDRLFAVGDLVDRGPDSDEVLDWLAKPWFFSVRGNHEQMAIDHADGFSDWTYKQNGGGWFLRLPRSHQKLIATCFKDLPIAIDIKAAGKLYGIVHGDVVYDDWNTLVEALDEYNGEGTGVAAMWNRTRLKNKDQTSVKNVELVYVGHTPLKQVEKYGNVVYIDTGAVFKNGSMTIMELTKETV
jgi:serine/threonine protein phosphatase 1